MSTTAPKRLRSMVASLEQLLDVFERATLEQADRLEEKAREASDRAEALEFANALLSAQMECAPGGVAVTDEEGRLLLVSEDLRALWDLPPGGAHDEESLLEHISGRVADPEALRTAADAFRGGAPVDAPLLLRRRDGASLELSPAPLRDSTGRTLGRLWHFRDVSERAELVEQLIQAQKMEAVGRLAGGIAHDFNNLLNVILGYASECREELPPDSPLAGDLGTVCHAAERAAELTRRLLEFSRPRREERTPVDIDRRIVDIDSMLRRTLGPAIELVVLPGAGAASVEVDPAQLEQVLLNLAVNARDAMGETGTLTVETARVPPGSAEAPSDLTHPRGYVALRVTDTGPGMDEEVLARAFDPFFTTKEVGKGTGLGLAICYRIVEDLGGRLLASSAPGQGATLTAFLPVAEQADAPAEEPPGLPPAGPTSEVRVLLVEDEAALRRLMARSLRKQGYTVLEAHHGQEALRILRDPETPPLHLLITDLVMPALGGWELIEAAGEERPELRFLVISGYDRSLERQPDSGEFSVLAKPFLPSQLLARVQEVLEG